MNNSYNKYFEDKTVLITGASGTVGRGLVAALSQIDGTEVRAFDNDESKLFFLGEDFKHLNVSCILGDLRDASKLDRSFRGVNVVLHAGAFKHVPLCEEQPMEAVQTNILGTQNVINAATVNGVERVIYTSTDKAVNPTSVMGTSKLMGEQLIRTANLIHGSETIFSSTRFGNVLGSRGSVVPLFREQIRKGGPVTLTDKKMTRFVMTMDEAVQLVLEAVVIANGGEVFVTKMNVLYIEDLAKVMIDELGHRIGSKRNNIEIKVTGMRAGEKLYEELMNTEETRRSIELQNHFAVLPALSDLFAGVDYDYPGIISNCIANPYNSHNETAMTPKEIGKYMHSRGLF